MNERHSLLRAPRIAGGDLQPESAATGAAGKGGGESHRVKLRALQNDVVFRQRRPVIGRSGSSDRGGGGFGHATRWFSQGLSRELCAFECKAGWAIQKGEEEEEEAAAAQLSRDRLKTIFWSRNAVTRRNQMPPRQVRGFHLTRKGDL